MVDLTKKIKFQKKEECLKSIFPIKIQDVSGKCHLFEQLRPLRQLQKKHPALSYTCHFVEPYLATKL